MFVHVFFQKLMTRFGMSETCVPSSTPVTAQLNNLPISTYSASDTVLLHPCLNLVPFICLYVITDMVIQVLLDLQYLTHSKISCTPFFVKFSCFLHIFPLATYVMQPSSMEMSVTFVSFSHCYLSYPANSHVKSSSFPHPTQLAKSQLSTWSSACCPNTFLARAAPAKDLSSEFLLPPSLCTGLSETVFVHSCLVPSS